MIQYKDCSLDGNNNHEVKLTCLYPVGSKMASSIKCYISR